MFSIRASVEADISAIAAIYAEAVLNSTATYEVVPPSEDEMRGRWHSIVGNGYPFIVAAGDGDEVLGFAYASSYRSRAAYNWLVEDSIYVALDARRRGIGRALLDKLILQCAAKGFRQMVAVIGGSNPESSVALHKACGFKHCGVMPASGFKHGQWLDTIFMQRPLGDGARSLPDLSAYPATMKH